MSNDGSDGAALGDRISSSRGRRKKVEQDRMGDESNDQRSEGALPMLTSTSSAPAILNDDNVSRSSMDQPPLSEKEWKEMNRIISMAEEYESADQYSANGVRFEHVEAANDHGKPVDNFEYHRAQTPATRYFKGRAAQLRKWSHKFRMEHDEKDVPIDLSLPSYTLNGMMTKLAIEAQMDSHKTIVENSRKRVDTQPPEALEWMLKRTKQRLVNRFPKLDVSRAIKNHNTPTTLHHIALHHKWHDKMLKRVKGHVRTRHTDPHIKSYFRQQRRRKRKDSKRRRERLERAGLLMSEPVPPTRQSPFPEVRRQMKNAKQRRRKPPKIYVIKKTLRKQNKKERVMRQSTPNLSRSAKTSMIY